MTENKDLKFEIRPGSDELISRFKSFAIVERDKFLGENKLVISFPAISELDEKVLTYRCSSSKFLFSKFNFTWQYFLTVSLDSLEKDTSGDITAFTLIFLSDSFNPEKFYNICKLFAQLYISNNFNATVLETVYLQLFCSGSFSTPYGNFDDNNYDDRTSLLNTDLISIIKSFGNDVILIYTAMLLKKRIFVYSENIPYLLSFIRSLPLLVWHRQDWSLLRPYCTLSEVELSDIKNGITICGFSDHRCETIEFYDLFIDLSTHKCSIPNQALETFKLTSFHSEILKFILESVNDPKCTLQSFIKALAMKNAQILSKLSEIYNKEGPITEKILQGQFPKDLEKLLFNIAVAEKMT